MQDCGLVTPPGPGMWNYRDDEPLTTVDGRRVPTLEFHDRLSPDLYKRYHHLVYGNQQVIRCEGSIRFVDDITLRNWLTRVLVERLENDQLQLRQRLIKTAEIGRKLFTSFQRPNSGLKPMRCHLS